MKYLIAKIYLKSNDIEYGKAFDNENEAISAASKLNEVSEANDGTDKVQFMVLPCVVMPKVREAE